VPGFITKAGLLLTNFKTYNLPNGIRFHLYPTEKFKTLVFSVFLHQNLRRELAAPTALLPYVLERGTGKWPTTRELAKAMEELYGADILTDIVKRGERHVLQFMLEIVNPLFVPGEENLEEKGLEVLKEVLSNPLLEEGRFKESYVKREKELLKNRIEGLINDKVSYALERCIQEMCREEKYGVYRLGQLEDLEKINSQNLYEYYQDVLARAPMDVFVLGKIDAQEILPLIEKAFDFKREDLWEIDPTQIYREVQEPRYVEERLEVSQGKLTLGYRTNTAVTDDDFYPLLFYNGILGAFPHSKLFQNVREKASLAYYANSRLERNKGIMLIASGIEINNYDKALKIIQEQVSSLKEGDITSYELESTRVGLINQVRVSEDNPYQIINRHLGGIIGGRQESIQEIIEQLKGVTREDVVRVAEKIKLDTIYFLRNKG